MYSKLAKSFSWGMQISSLLPEVPYKRVPKIRLYCNWITEYIRACEQQRPVCTYANVRVFNVYNQIDFLVKLFILLLSYSISCSDDTNISHNSTVSVSVTACENSVLRSWRRSAWPSSWRPSGHAGASWRCSGTTMMSGSPLSFCIRRRLKTRYTVTSGTWYTGVNPP